MPTIAPTRLFAVIIECTVYTHMVTPTGISSVDSAEPLCGILKGLGFHVRVLDGVEVVPTTDVCERVLVKRLTKLRRNDLLLVFFAGYAIATGGDVEILPVDFLPTAGTCGGSHRVHRTAL
jgi:hypothetical protein